MNERIKELYIQTANETADGKEWAVGGLLNAKRFAELIVGECLNQCYNRGMNDELYEGQLRAAEYIEQHFGIE